MKEMIKGGFGRKRSFAEVTEGASGFVKTAVYLSYLSLVFSNLFVLMAVVLTTEPTNEDTYLVNGIPIRWKIIIFITVGGMLSGSYGRYRFLHGQVRQAMYGSCHISQLYHLNVIILGLMVLSEIGSEYLTRDAMIAFLWLELILWLPSYFLFMSDDVRTTCIVVNPPEDPLEPPVAYGPIPYANVIRILNGIMAIVCMVNGFELANEMKEVVDMFDKFTGVRASIIWLCVGLLLYTILMFAGNVLINQLYPENARFIHPLVYGIGCAAWMSLNYGLVYQLFILGDMMKQEHLYSLVGWDSLGPFFICCIVMIILSGPTMCYFLHKYYGIMTARWYRREIERQNREIGNRGGAGANANVAVENMNANNNNLANNAIIHPQAPAGMPVGVPAGVPAYAVSAPSLSTTQAGSGTDVHTVEIPFSNSGSLPGGAGAHTPYPTPVAPSSQYDAPPPAYSDLPPAYNAFADAPNNAGDGGAGAPAAAGVFCPTTGTIT